MRSDLQKLEITQTELKKLTGIDLPGINSRISPNSIKLQVFIFGALSLVLAVSFLLNINNFNFFAIQLLVSSMVCAYITFDLWTKLKELNFKLLKEVDKYNQLLLNINTLDELHAIGNPVKLNERKKVIEALRINRENLVRALKTERILKENPQFRPEEFNVIDLSGLRALQVTEKASEYGQLLDEALQIGVSVQTEMRKLENERLGL